MLWTYSRSSSAKVDVESILHKSSGPRWVEGSGRNGVVMEAD